MQTTLGYSRLIFVIAMTTDPISNLLIVYDAALQIALYLLYPFVTCRWSGPKEYNSMAETQQIWHTLHLCVQFL